MESTSTLLKALRFEKRSLHLAFSASVSGELEHRNEVRAEEEGAHTRESVSSAGRRWEKTDGIEEVLSSREKQIVCLTQKQLGKEVPR